MPMNAPQDLLDDPHHAATGFIRTVEHPSEGRLRSPGVPTRWSGTPPAADATPAPRLGEHSRELLREIGYGDDDIAAMLASGACMAATTLSPETFP
jgi:crotonobetainyl-CoA:carnitine CoA-transferase CaiB-like acyl-CoA transferase